MPASVVTAVLEAAHEFFALPLEERQAIDNLNSPQFRGCTRVGHVHMGGRPDRWLPAHPAVAERWWSDVLATRKA